MAGQSAIDQQGRLGIGRDLAPIAALSLRIDLVLTRGAVSVQDIKVVGDRAIDRTSSGLWPSDHAGLVATLRIGGED